MEYLNAFGQYLSDVLTVSIKILYPAYATFKAVKSRHGADDTTWLIYWVVCGVLTFLEHYIVPFVEWIPFFMLARTVLYVWLQMPFFNGSIILYRKLVLPFFSKNEKTFDLLTITDKKDAEKTIETLDKSAVSVFDEIYNSLLEKEAGDK